MKQKKPELKGRQRRVPNRNKMLRKMTKTKEQGQPKNKRK